MPLNCFACFGGGERKVDVPFVSPIEEKAVDHTAVETQRRDDVFFQDLQSALSGAPTDSAEARIHQIAALILRHLHARVVRLYGWSTDDAEEGASGHLVLLAVEWKRSGGTAGAAGGSGATMPPLPPPELLDMPGQRVAIPAKPPVAVSPPPVACTYLLQQAVHSKTPAVFSGPQRTPAAAAATSSSSVAATIMPPDCAADHAAVGASAFAALPLTSGDRLLGVLWVGTAATAKSEPTAPYDGLPPPPVLRQVASSVSMCLLGGVEPEYLAWLTGSLRRLAAATTLQALVGELCDATAQHVRRRFLIDAVAHAAVVPEPRSTVGFMLDHRPQPGGPGGVARWAAAAASRQASVTFPAQLPGLGGPGGTAGGPPRGAMVSGASLRRSDSFTSQMGPAGRAQQQRSSAHAPLRPYASNSKRNLVEQAAARSAAAAAAAASGAAAASAVSANTVSSAASDAVRLGTGGGAAGAGGAAGRLTPGGHACEAAAAAAAVAAGVVPSLRAKGFQLSHTLLQRMVSAPEGRGPDGVYSGLAVADCGRHVQDVHQPSRDVCMLMAGGVRGADMTADASDSNIFASERSTGRIAMQSLVLVGVDVGRLGQQQQQPDAAGGAGGGGCGAGGGAGGGGGGGGGAMGAVLALYLAFPNRLPPLLVSSAHASCRQMLSVMLARLVRIKVATDLEAEFQTLCAGVPGSYAIVPSTPPGARPDPHAAGATPGGPAAAAGAGGAAANGHHAATANGGGSVVVNGAGLAGFAQSPLDASGLRGVALEPSIGAVTRASSCKLVPLNGKVGAGGVPGPGMSLGASAQLLAAFTDAGCRPLTAQGSIGRLDTPPRPGLPAADASGRVFPQTHDGSARTHGGSAMHPPGNVISLCQDRLFESTAEEEEEEEDASPTHEEADMMLSSDPRVDEDEDEDEVGGVGEGARASRVTARRSAAASARRTGSTANAGGTGYSSAAIREQEDDDLFPSDLPDYPAIAPRVPATPAAVLTVSEADGTSSMRQHMGLLVESLMSTLRSTAQMDEPHFDSAVMSARRSMDLELEDLRLSGVLGDGGSGVVLCGMLGTVPVAVKIIQMPEVDQLLLATTAKVLGQQEPASKPAPPAPTHGSPRGKGGSAGGAAPPRQQPSPGQPGGGGPQPGGQVAQYGGGGGGGGGGGEGAVAPGRVSMSSSKLKQARRDMLRNAMELAVMRSISHVNITTVYAVYDNVILERVKRDGGSTAYALRRQGPEDMLMDKAGSKPVFVALCMELCDSGSLASKLEERSFPRVLLREEEGRSRGTRLLDMVGIYLTVLEVACALRYLHARRLLHRDIKSANILLRSSPTDPRGWTCKLADFGSALVLDQFQPPEEMPTGSPADEAGLGQLLTGMGEASTSGRWFAIQEQSWGTITHMSPESMDNNSRVDASSDIFALGIVMWEIASGRGYRPYKELAPEQIGAAVRRGLRPTFTSEVPLPYRALAQQCWATEPHKRPSAVQVVAQIKAQLSQLQSEARQHPQQQQQQHFVNQSPAVARSPPPQ